MGRISISCLLPASWHFSLSPVGCPRVLNASLRQLLLLAAAAAAAALLLCSLLLLRGRHRQGRFQRYLARVTDTEATDTGNPNLSYGIVVDCGSSGSRVFVYCWPRHNGNPKDLLDIQQMRDSSRKPVVMKIKPGISEFASSPEQVSDYIAPLLSFAARHVPRSKHRETPLYILCTAGMRILPQSQQKAILEDLLTDIPVHFDFLFSDSHAEVISGKQEGVYAWIGINFVLGRFEHTDDEDEAVVEVQVPGSEHHDPVFRKRTVGILDMGGVSTQIAYEVPPSEEVAKSLLAEVNLGCDAHQTEHVYRLYVATFLGFGGNAARRRYEESLLSSRNRQAGLSPQAPLPDPCLPRDAPDELRLRGLRLHLRGTGDFQLCRERLRPLLNRTNGTGSSLNGVRQPPLQLQSSEFYGFSEFYYCTEDVLRMGGDYSAARITVPRAGRCCGNASSAASTRPTPTCTGSSSSALSPPGCSRFSTGAFPSRRATAACGRRCRSTTRRCSGRWGPSCTAPASCPSGTSSRRISVGFTLAGGASPSSTIPCCSWPASWWCCSPSCCTCCACAASTARPPPPPLPCGCRRGSPPRNPPKSRPRAPSCRIHPHTHTEKSHFCLRVPPFFAPFFWSWEFQGNGVVREKCQK
ncbi:ectonucleoside triphosphate diphosphohydrolase 4 isoform X2 [Serinus canaria]|uniref:ectonucleoside triphosphate diphosphohydrolase 4 isoform X2 n=1 Tax=Serinus canaria TaxID=9135 RepID=UPI0021CCCC93|nr:ectonucleoside triphosphate diphosphohydrolase 4 isoform X2 [Serinus canaria]